MPLDSHLVAAAMQSGLSAVCSTCQKYWDGRAKGLPEPQCTAATACGSPLAGDTFHEYVGPLTDFTRWCFVCASAAQYGVTVKGHARIIGVCRGHVRMLANLKPVSGLVVPASPLIKLPTGEEKPVEKVVEAPKPTLGAAIAEAEKDFEGS